MKTFSETLKSHTKLSIRRTHSLALLDKACKAIKGEKNCSKDYLSIFVAGSVGRLEVGDKSDLDIFLIAKSNEVPSSGKGISRLEEILVLSGLIRVNSNLELPEFSGDGRYFNIHEVSDLLQHTGTPVDDSENLFTTRLLLLLESKCIWNESIYRDATQKIIEMYFRDGKGKKAYKPLFLINDILRYWRTLCLNYENTRTDPQRPWWKKNLNLKFSRKLTVFSTLLLMLALKIDNYNSFQKISEMTPMERLAHGLDEIGESKYLEQFNSFLDYYEGFLAAKSNSNLNEESKRNHSLNAELFDQFLHSIFNSDKLQKELVKYLLI